MPAERGGPPGLAELLVRARLPRELAEPVAGDLDEEYRARLARGQGRLLADLWYWVQVATLRVGALRRTWRRLAAMRPTWERNRPGRVRHDDPRRVWMPIRPEDLRYAVRRLARAPGFTVVAVLSLALGIGANTAMFSLVNAVLLRDLPVRAPHELVEVYTSEQDGYPYATSSYPDYLDLKERDEVFQAVVATRTFISRIERGARPEAVFGEAVSWDYFSALGVPMALGRSFLAEEDVTPGTHPVVILGHRMWQRDFGADPSAVGAEIRLDGRPYTIVGVAPEAFTGSMPVLVTSLFVPGTQIEDVGGFAGQLERRGNRSLFLKARLKPGVGVAQASASLEAFSAALATEYPDSNEGRVMSALPAGDVALHPFVDRILKPVAGLLLVVVGLVLVIACANLASFLLARAEDRRREIAVRLALGAGRGTLVRQLLVETVLLAALGGLAGIVLAHWTLGLLMSFQPPLPVPVAFDVSLDRTVLLFTGVVSLIAGIAFGLAPALQATNPDVAPTLKNEATGGGRPRRVTLRKGLVVAQVSLSFVLLIGAGLFVRSLQKAQLVDPGFDTGPAAMMWPLPEASGYDTPERVAALFDLIEERLLAHPVIERVAMADRLPLGIGVQTAGYVLPGVPSESADGDIDLDNASVSPGYFEAMGVPIVQGRAFERADRDGGGVAIVSEAFVRRYYPGEELVGRTIERSNGMILRVVGVARDTKVRTLGEAPRPYVYELAGHRGRGFGLQVVGKGRGSGPELLEAMRTVLDEVDPNLVLLEAKTMNEHLALMLFPPRMAALLLTVFGGLALALAAIGIYGVVSHAVAKRTRELGIRMSLGASAGDVVRMAVGGGMRLVLAGGTIGLLLAAGLSWSISGFLYGVGATDMATFAAIPVLLSLVALVAAWVPARRASTVDPVSALRTD